MTKTLNAADRRHHARKFISEYPGVFVTEELPFLEAQGIFTPKDLRDFLEVNGISRGATIHSVFELLEASSGSNLSASVASVRAAYLAAKRAKEERRPPLSAEEMTLIIGAVKTKPAYTASVRARPVLGIDFEPRRTDYNGDPHSLPPEIKSIHDELLPVLNKQRWVSFEALKNACELSLGKDPVTMMVDKATFEKLYTALNYMYPNSRAIRSGRLARWFGPMRAERPGNGFLRRVRSHADQLAFVV